MRYSAVSLFLIFFALKTINMSNSKPLSQAEMALRTAALEYHSQPTKGKITVRPTKALSNQRDLSLAYSPGVAYACMEIFHDPSMVSEYTSRANLVGVVTNGTAVLGLGNIGPLAGKPVMEGKACLFKKFAGIDVFDIELNEHDPEKLVDIIASLEPTLGGINLEDIKAPECFYIERKLTERLNIPVFHDDQHGTAIISSAALLNGLELVGKRIGDVKLTVSGAGAAAIACMELLMLLGVKRENIMVCDSKGVIYEGRPGNLDASKQQFARKTEARTLADAVKGADVFLGCSAADVLTPEMVKTMADKPIILALANPNPEIRPELAKEARPDCIIATGRSDYPNQVNNVLCFPYIFRGALDAGATRITGEMKMAAVREIAALAKEDVSAEVASAYSGRELMFGPEYIIPTPFDNRLILRIAPAVAKAAQKSGVATRPIEDMDAYRHALQRFVLRTSMVMRPVFNAAKNDPKRIVFAEGEDERVLRAVQECTDEKMVKPLLIGRPSVIEARIKRAGLHIQVGRDLELIDPENNPHYFEYAQAYQQLLARDGVTPDMAKAEMHRTNTVIAAMLVRQGIADGMLCGLVGRFDVHLDKVQQIFGRKDPSMPLATMHVIMLDNRTLFVADTAVNLDPTAEELAAIAEMASKEVGRFGIPPRVAFLSHSMFGSRKNASSLKMRAARDLFKARCPDIPSDGEMHGDAALDENARKHYMPESTLTGTANLLITPNLDASSILCNVLKVASGQGVMIGPIMLGSRYPVHILPPSSTVRRIINMTALVVAQCAH